MAGVLLFHHALGQTAGFHQFADALRNAGHRVHTPDLFGGRCFATLEEGLAYATEAGFEEIIARGERAARKLPDDLVYMGFWLGVPCPQKLAQTRAGARAPIAANEHAELFLYAGSPHYFADSSLRTYDARAAALLRRRVRDFLRVRA